MDLFTNIVTYSPKLMVKATLMFRPDFKIQNSKQRESKIWLLFEELDHLNFGFVPNFDIRISDLPIPIAACVGLYQIIRNRTYEMEH